MANKLAIFDVDGTIANKSILAPTILDGFKHLQEAGYLTTISTGRSYVSVKASMGEDLDRLISDDALIIVEYGTKIVTKKGDVVFIEEFSPDEIEHLIDFVRANIDLYRMMWFSFPDPSKKMQFWCYDKQDVAEAIEKRPYADVFTCNLSELKKRLLSAPISNVELKLRDHVKVHNLVIRFTRTQTNIIFQDGIMGFVKNNTNKAIAVRNLSNRLGVDMQDILVAGNAINDAEMLSTSVGKRILVGPKEESDPIIPYISESDQIIRIESPEALGEYLQTLS